MGTEFLLQEAKALLVRLQQVQPFSLNMPMVKAAAITEQAHRAITDMLVEGRKGLVRKIHMFIELVHAGSSLPAQQKQAAYALLKLQFNALLDRLDIFADVLTQRSEHQTGIWLAGLDVLAEDALKPKMDLFQIPPLVCFLDRGHGAAIRRVRTRLPGGSFNPVAIIRIPRERMISTGIASSLVHEVGHQGAALLDLIPSLKQALQQKAGERPQQRDLWQWYERWISEIVADFWGVATLGVGSTTGLMNVVSLPGYFVFRLNTDDPHPPPWLRVQLSIEVGARLYPDPQWKRLKKLWEQLYPLSSTSPEKRREFRRLLDLAPHFVEVLVSHSNPLLQGHQFSEIFPLATRQPRRLRGLFQLWRHQPSGMGRKKPALVFAVLGQARADNLISPVQEYHHLTDMFQHWAMNHQN